MKKIIEVARNEFAEYNLPHLRQDLPHLRISRLAEILPIKTFPLDTKRLQMLSAITAPISDAERLVSDEVADRLFDLKHPPDVDLDYRTFPRTIDELADIQNIMADGLKLFGIPPTDSHGWINLAKKLADFMLFIKKHNRPRTLKQAEASLHFLNQAFLEFVKLNYPKWVNGHIDRPMLSIDVLGKITRELLTGNKVLFLVFDGMSLEQWQKVACQMQVARSDAYFAVLPSSTVYSRNSLFSGLLPAQIHTRYPKGLDGNRYEREMLTSFIQKARIKTRTDFDVIGVDIEHGVRRLKESITNQDTFIVRIFKFLDDQMHRFAEEKNMPLEKVYDVCFEHVFDSHRLVQEVIEYARDLNYRVIITSDHGNVKTKRVEKIDFSKREDIHSRYVLSDRIPPRYSRNPDFIVIEKPKDWGLPDAGLGYIIAGSDIKFGTDERKVPITHGGISLQEVIIPFAVL
jgi:hypothetical protein